MKKHEKGKCPPKPKKGKRPPPGLSDVKKPAPKGVVPGY